MLNLVVDSHVYRSCFNPSRYAELAEMTELVEDYALFAEAERRCAASAEFVPEQDIMSSLGISEEELSDVED